MLQCFLLLARNTDFQLFVLLPLLSTLLFLIRGVVRSLRRAVALQWSEKDCRVSNLVHCGELEWFARGCLRTSLLRSITVNLLLCFSGGSVPLELFVKRGVLMLCVPVMEICKNSTWSKFV